MKLTMELRGFYGRLLLWRGRNITERQFILILSFVTGISGGLAAIVLKNTIELPVHGTFL